MKIIKWSVAMRFIATLVGLWSIVTPAMADEVTNDVGQLSANATAAYSTVRLVGNPDLCAGADAGYRNIARIDRGDAGAEEIMKILLAAKLAGYDVKLVTEVRSARCYVARVDLL